MTAITKEAIDAIKKMNYQLMEIGEILVRIQRARDNLLTSPVDDELLDIVEKLANLVNELALKE